MPGPFWEILTFQTLHFLAYLTRKTLLLSSSRLKIMFFTELVHLETKSQCGIEVERSLPQRKEIQVAP